MYFTAMKPISRHQHPLFRAFARGLSHAVGWADMQSEAVDSLPLAGEMPMAYAGHGLAQSWLGVQHGRGPAGVPTQYLHF
jgi:hypothetical protein